jgi:prophage DNA circulation protein
MAKGCYTEPYLPGSFKAVPFKAMEVTSEHGRRGAEGEFPFGEVTGYADLGRRIRTYSISARFDSNAHVLEAAALIAACELPGPGPLVHPTRGVILSAAVRSLKVTDKVEEEQGVTYVDMEFVEANNWPNGLSLLGQVLGLAIAPLITASRASFSANYRPTEVQAFRQDAVVNAAQEQVGSVTNAYVAATTTEATSDERNRIVYEMRNVQNVDSEAENTETMDRALSLGMNAVALKLRGVDKFNAFRQIANGASKQSSFAATAGEAENAVYSHVRTLAAAYMAEGAMEAADLSAPAIFEQSDIIYALITQEMEYARSTCQNDLFLQMSKFRSDVQARLNDKAYNSPGLVEFDFVGNVHPLVAAYSIFGDAKRHRQLETTNSTGAVGRLASPVLGTV